MGSLELTAVLSHSICSNQQTSVNSLLIVSTFGKYFGAITVFPFINQSGRVFIGEL